MFKIERMTHSTVCAALIGGAVLGIFGAGACDDAGADCADAETPDDCDAIALPNDHRCAWGTIRRFGADGSCAVEEEREACVEFAGTAAGCNECETPDDVGFVRDPSELFVAQVCGQVPVGWRSCLEDPDNPSCACGGC